MLVAVIGLVGLMVVGGVAIAILIFVFWRETHFKKQDSRLNQLEQELAGAVRNAVGMTNLMGDQLVAYDHELSEVWSYVLPRKGPP